MAGPTAPAENLHSYDFDNRPFRGDGSNYLKLTARTRFAHRKDLSGWAHANIDTPHLTEHATLNATWSGGAVHQMYFGLWVNNNPASLPMDATNCPQRIGSVNWGDGGLETGDTFGWGDQANGLILCPNVSGTRFRQDHAHYAEISVERLGPNDVVIKAESAYTSENGTLIEYSGLYRVHVQITTITAIGLNKAPGTVLNSSMFARWW